MKNLSLILCALCLFISPFSVFCEDKPVISSATLECLGCHGTFHPGIAEDWKKSRHAVMTPEKAMRAGGP